MVVLEHENEILIPGEAILVVNIKEFGISLDKNILMLQEVVLLKILFPDVDQRILLLENKSFFVVKLLNPLIFLVEVEQEIIDYLKFRFIAESDDDPG